MSPSAPASPDPERLAEAVLRVGDVDSLHGGLVGEVATYLPGKRLPGIRVRDGRVEVHIVVLGGRPLADTATEVRRAVRAQAPACPVDVIVGDIVTPSPVAPSRVAAIAAPRAQPAPAAPS